MNEFSCQFSDDIRIVSKASEEKYIFPEVMGTPQYYSWIDVAKVIGIYFVTIGHGSLVSKDYTTLIYSFHIPLFFLLSGLLYKRRNIRESFKKINRALIVPYLIINAICLLYYFVLQGKTCEEHYDYFIWSRIGAIFMGLGYEAGGWIPVSTPLWFAYCLALVYIIISLSHSIVQDVFITLLSLAGFYFLQRNSIDLYVPLDSALMAIPFFMIGFHLKKYIMTLSKSKYNFFALFLIPFWYWLATINGRSDMDICVFGSNLVLFYITGVIGFIVVITISQILSKIMPGGGQK